MINNELAKLIVDNIIEDLSDRRGLGQEWSMIDEEIQEEIRMSWIKIITKCVSPSTNQ